MISTSTGVGQEHISLSHQGRHISEACLEMIILMESDLCQLACFTVSYSFQCKQLFGQHTMISARRTPTDARFAG